MINILDNYKNTNNIINDASFIIDESKNKAYRAINTALVERNWLLGYRISHEILKGRSRAEYGDKVISNLSKVLTEKYGNGFNSSELHKFYKFYKLYPEIVAPSGPQLDTLLTWSHYKILITIEDKVVRDWYEKEAIKETWTRDTLQRNVSSQYYYRILKNQNIKGIKDSEELNRLEFIKSPLITEFLNISNSYEYKESDLEKSIIDNLQKFMIELGKGYAFVGRQYHIRSNNDYYIDLVFYNYILKCFVLIDLKTSKITSRDVGQMDMYIKMFDKLKRNSDDNPTIGIILCSDTDEDVLKYSILNDYNNLYASKYKLYLPTEEQIKNELLSNKSIYNIQKELLEI